MADKKRVKWTADEVAVAGSRTCVCLTSRVPPCLRSLRWFVLQDLRLQQAVERHNAKNWKRISEEAFGGTKTDVQCLHRWQKVLDPSLVKGPWTKEEDDKVVRLVHEHGPKKWSQIASHLPGRIGKQCRERSVLGAAFGATHAPAPVALRHPLLSRCSVLSPSIYLSIYLSVCLCLSPQGAEEFWFALVMFARVPCVCVYRWHNHLNPDIKKEPWSEEEDRKIIELHRSMGNKWAEIAKYLPGR